MDEYVTVYDYVGNENSTTTTANKEEHEMLKTPRKVQQEIQINQTSTSTNANQVEGHIKDSATVTRKFLLAMLILMVLMISLAAIVLSIVSYKASDTKMVDLNTKLLAQFNSYKMDMEFKLMQLNSTLQLQEQQGAQSKINTSLIIQVAHNISKLFEQYSTTNYNITSLATTIENNITRIHLQLDAINNLAIIEQAQSTRLHCGPGLWYRVAYLNMSDPSHQCPTPWRMYGTGNIRVCGRANSTTGSCSSVAFSMAGRSYSRVCGRLIGYQVASPDGFRKYIGNNNINFDGINITYGTQHHHIWSYVAGVTESAISNGPSNCPCSTVAGRSPPSFIGNRYYCESGNPTDTFVEDHVYTSDPLWDGQNCEGTCCTGTNSPPWFSVELPAPTTDMIEVSICGDESTRNEDTPIQLLELHMQ